MPEITQLEQLLCIYRNGTLSKAAEELHLSQPALSRSMQRLEEDLKVNLFTRQKNKIEFNTSGEMAVKYALKVLNQMQDMVDQLRIYERSQRTISVGSCAPAPLWDISPLLSTLYSQMTISSEISETEKLIHGLDSGVYQIIVIPHLIQSQDIYCTKYGEERLFFNLPPGHALSGKKELYFKDLDGETMLLHSKIGFWHDMHLRMMSSTHFLLQDDYFTFSELVKASALPSFTSDVVMKKEGKPKNRVIIPILDEEAHVTYYCACKADTKRYLSSFFNRIESRSL